MTPPAEAASSNRRSMPEATVEVVTNWLRIVAEPMRVRIMILLDTFNRGATVQQLCERLPATTHQNVSKHLAVLYGAGLVTRSKEGNAVRYELADWTALWMVDQIAAQVVSDT
jgi:DNA-binding transcriptional ArsR family regulator